jgi:hypothetical protein
MSKLIDEFRHCQRVYSPSNSILLLNFLDKLNENEVTEVNTYVQETYLKSTDNNTKSSSIYYLLSVDFLRNKTHQRIVGLIGNLKYNYTSKKYEYAVITESDYTFYFNQLTEEEYKKVITCHILWFLPNYGIGLIALSKRLSLDEKKKFREIYLKTCNSYDISIPVNKSIISSDRTYLIKEKILEDTSLQKIYESTLAEYKSIALNDSTSDAEFSNFFNQLNPRESAILSGPFGYYHSGKKLITFLSLLDKQKLEKLDIINREENLGPFSRIRQIIFDLVFQDFEIYHQQLAPNKYNNSYFTKYSSGNYDYERPADFLSKLVPLNLIKSPLLSQYLHLVYEEEDKHHLFVFLKQLAERDKNIILHFIALFDRKSEFDLTRIFFDKGDIPCDELIGRDPDYPSFEREKHLFYPLLADEAMIYKMLPLHTPKWYQTELSKGIKEGYLNSQELQRLDKAGLYKISNSDLISDTFEKVFINNEDIIPFLQKLKAKDKKTLKPYIVNSSWFEDLIKKGVVSNEENNIKKGAAFAFFMNRNEINNLDHKAHEGFIEGLKLCLENIPNFYPKWINQYFIDHSGYWDGLISIGDYIYFSENGLLNIDLHPHIAVSITLDYLRYENNNRYKKLNKEDSRNLYFEEYFDKEDKKNLYFEKYFWLVFEYSPLNNRYGISFVKNYINTFIDHKAFDRNRFLYETLSAIGKGFGRESTKMFYDLFMTLKPSKEELLSLQEELLEVFIELNSNKKLQKIFSPLVEEIIANENFDKALFFDSLPFLRQRDLDKALELIIKVIQNHNKDIDKADFFEHIPLLLKQIPAASIDLVINFVQAHKETLSQEDLVNLCLLVTEVLGLSKKSIHKKAATFIAENAPNQNEQVGESVKKYADNISTPCKKLLKAFFTKEEITKKR